MKYFTDTHKKLIGGAAVLGALYFGYYAFDNAQSDTPQQTSEVEAPEKINLTTPTAPAVLIEKAPVAESPEAVPTGVNSVKEAIQENNELKILKNKDNLKIPIE